MMHRGVFVLGLVLTTTSFNKFGAYAQEVPFTAIVIDSIVSVRAGAGRSFYEVGKLTKGSHVTVEEVVFGWNKILPPQDTYSFISRAFVDAYGDGKSGRVNTDRAAVRAGSVNGPGESYRRQIDLLKGDTVEIHGEIGSFYQITPPRGAYVFLPPGSVERLDVPGRVKPNEVVSKPVSSSPEKPIKAEAAEKIVESISPSTSHRQKTTDNVNTEQSATKETARSTVAIHQPRNIEYPTLQELENKLIQSQELPLEKQPITELLQSYRELKNRADLSLLDGRIVTLRIVQLQRNAALAQTLRDIHTARRNADLHTLQTLLNEVSQSSTKDPYSARGRLLASSVYNGKSLPLLFRVVVPSTNRIITYIRLHPKIDPSSYVGKYVGIVGTPQHDKMLRINVIDAQHIDVIGHSAAR